MAAELTDEPPSGWITFDLTPLDPLDGTEIPIKLAANRFKSSSMACDDFIHEPLSVLIRAQGTPGFPEGLELDESWTVTTHIVNHHRGLRATHLYATVAADTKEKTIGITLVKKAP